jgi:leucyl/phenylalanyl-tRNA--protein transferase
VGGDLHPARLLNAYAGGIFPWFSEGEPILWWSPDPRMVFRTDGVHLSSRFRRQLRGSTWEVTADTAFSRVMRACAAAPRPGQDGTWISPDMVEAYSQLHDLGFAHSFEVWDRQTLVGGIYGVAIGTMFFGEHVQWRQRRLQDRPGRAGIHASRLGLGADRCPGGESAPAADGRRAPAARGVPAACARPCAVTAVKARGRRRSDACRHSVWPGVNTNFASWAGHA